MFLVNAADGVYLPIQYFSLIMCSIAVIILAILEPILKQYRSQQSIIIF